MYKLISPANYFSSDLLETVCKNRGVDIKKIKNPSSDDIIHYSKLNKIDKVANAIVHFASNRESKVGLVVDSDP